MTARSAHILAALITVAVLAGCAAPAVDRRPAETEAQQPGPVYRDTAASPVADPLAATPPTTPPATAATPAESLPADPGQAAVQDAEELVIEDLIAQLRRGFSLPRSERAEVRREIEWFARHPAYFERVLNRARPYLPHVAAEVEARGLPAELAFLPMIESAYDPFAYSHGRAAGLWQIVPGTGRHYGLKQNWWYDGRRDVVESTRAALDYLEYLHALFDGDWLLAIAAYNCGQGTMGRAVRHNRAAGRPVDFWHLRLPKETRHYVPRLLGLAQVLADPEKYQLALPEIPPEAAFSSVELDGQIDLAVAAELAGIELLQLQALNPGFNQWATDPEGPHRLLLPPEVADDFKLALAELPAEARVRWLRHKVRPGDTLGGIAQRYGTTIGTLQAVNDISGTRIRAGAHLMVPTSTRSVAEYPLSADNRLARTQDRARDGRVRREHTVRNGESLWSISRRHGVGVRELAAWNGMAPGDTLAVGRTLVVWPQAGKSAARAQHAEPTVRRINYTVRRGDSLYRIASNFRVSVNDIKRWNRLDGESYLQPGQRLVLHVDVTAQSGG